MKKYVSELMSRGESETLEFKTSFGKEAIETLVAFASSKGGILLIGISDDGSVIGEHSVRKRFRVGLISVNKAALHQLFLILISWKYKIKKLQLLQ